MSALGTPRVGQFALVRGWRNVEVEEIGKVTPKLVRTKGWRARQVRIAELLAFFDEKEQAEQLAQALNGAGGQRDDRIRTAREDFEARRDAAVEAYRRTEERLIDKARGEQ